MILNNTLNIPSPYDPPERFRSDTAKAIGRIRDALGPNADPSFGSLTLQDLIAERLVASDASKKLVSSDLVNWVAGTANQVIVTDDSDGTITLATPQDIHVDATPEFEGLIIKYSDDSVIMEVSNTEFFVTSVPIQTGQAMGLLLSLTYTLP